MKKNVCPTSCPLNELIIESGEMEMLHVDLNLNLDRLSWLNMQYGWKAQTTERGQCVKRNSLFMCNVDVNQSVYDVLRSSNAVTVSSASSCFVIPYKTIWQYKLRDTSSWDIVK